MLHKTNLLNIIAHAQLLGSGTSSNFLIVPVVLKPLDHCSSVRIKDLLPEGWFIRSAEDWDTAGTGTLT